jgi:hypothetical protein
VIEKVFYVLPVLRVQGVSQRAKFWICSRRISAVQLGNINGGGKLDQDRAYRLAEGRLRSRMRRFAAGSRIAPSRSRNAAGARRLPDSRRSPT